MSNKWKSIFTILVIISTLHLLRDILQIIGIHNSVVDLLHWPHQWCKTYCDYVTIPPELFIIISSVVILHRDKVGKLGFMVLISLLFWPIALLLP